MKTFLVFHPSSELYGSDRILVSVLAAMERDAKKIIYVGEDGPLVPYLKDRVANVECIFRADMPTITRAMLRPMGVLTFARRMLSFSAYLRGRYRKANINLAYVNTLACVFVLVPLWMMRIRRYIHVHEIIEVPRTVDVITARVAGALAHRVICVSEAVRQHLVSLSPAIESKATVIYNGVDPVEVMPREIGNPINFYLFGRIKRGKGQRFLLQALSVLPADVLQRCRFALRGGPVKGGEDEVDALREYLKANNLTEYVELKEFVADIRADMSRADVCLVPSIMKDPFPTTVLEAMSAGKAVIATNNGGAVEALSGDSGLLVAPDDKYGLAQAIQTLVGDRELIVEYGRRGKQRYLQYFTRGHFTENWQRFLREFTGHV